MYEGSITISIPTDVKDIERLNRLVRQFGELHEIPGRALYAMNLALDEVATNVILHGTRAGATDELQVRLEVAGRELRSEVIDGGLPFNPLDVPPPDLEAPLSERQLGGLGIHLVRSLMDRLDYRHEESKNVLTMMKRIR